jgi:hypothetical protein
MLQHFERTCLHGQAGIRIHFRKEPKCVVSSHPHDYFTIHCGRSSKGSAVTAFSPLDLRRLSYCRRPHGKAANLDGRCCGDERILGQNDKNHLKHHKHHEHESESNAYSDASRHRHE